LLEHVTILQRGSVDDISEAIPEMDQMRFAFNYFFNNAVTGLLRPVTSRNEIKDEMDLPYDINFVELICKKIIQVLN
jgi:hypothetical protein